MPDRFEFVGQHNLFDIQRNGEFVLKFEVCDVDGYCGSSEEYKLHVGPFYTLRGPLYYKHFEDSNGNAIFGWAAVGSIGFDTQKVDQYICLVRMEDKKVFSFYDENPDPPFAPGWHEGFVPFDKDFSFLSGGYRSKFFYFPIYWDEDIPHSPGLYVFGNLLHDKENELWSSSFGTAILK